jgi:hypothetical protein
VRNLVRDGIRNRETLAGGYPGLNKEPMRGHGVRSRRTVTQSP